MEYYNVGKIVNTHGVRGGVRILTTTDSIDERFAKGNTSYPQQSGEPSPLTIESTRQHEGFVLVRFVGYDNVNDVEQFRGHGLMANTDDQQPLNSGQYYYYQTIGLDVETTDGRHLGKVKEILSPGANDVWVVRHPEKRDLLLPVIDDTAKNVDLDKDFVIVELMKGLE